MKLIGIVGSVSDRSHNRALLKFIQKHFANNFELEICESRDLPIFDAGVDEYEVQPVVELAKKIEAADGVILSTAEYNHSIPAALKSTLEWLSHNLHPLAGKPVMVIGASTDVQGSSRAQLHLRQILNAPGINAIVLPGNEFLLGNASKAFDDHGNIKDAGTITFLESCIRKFRRFIKVASLLSVPEEIDFEPGTYEVMATGVNDTFPMTVTFSNDRIENIKIGASNRSSEVADEKITAVIEQIIAEQTLNLDQISGEMLTSRDIIDAVSAAIKLANADPTILKNRPKPN